MALVKDLDWNLVALGAAGIKVVEAEGKVSVLKQMLCKTENTHVRRWDV